MNLLIAQCTPEPESRSLFTFDFDHSTIQQQKEEAAFFVIAVLSDYKKDFYFTSVINNGTDRPDLIDAWINNGLAALISLRRNFKPDTWQEVLDLAYDLAKNEYQDETLADNIKEYRFFVLHQ